MSSENLSIAFEWTPHGGVSEDGSTVRFEATPRAPGLYRIDFDETHTYIGETTNLARRFAAYRSPGGFVDTTAPRTNRRVQRTLLKAINDGHSIVVRTCTSASLVVDGQEVPLPLDDKAHRLLVETSAIILAKREGRTLENLHRR